MSDKCAAIIELHRTGKINSEIIKLLKAPKSPVSHTVNRFEELSSAKDRPRSDRPQTSRTPKVINAVRARIRRNPMRPIRKIAREIDLSEKTVKNIVQTDLKFLPIKLQTCHHLANLQKKIRSSKNSAEQNEVRYGHRRDHFLR